MKKILISFCVIIALGLAFSGCLWEEAPQEEIQPGQRSLYERHSGVIKELKDKESPKKATHLLEKENDEIVFVFSNFYDLDSKKYLDKKVEVRGVLIQESEDNVLEIEDIMVLEEDEEEKEGLWKDHKNSLLGISIQQKSNLTVEEYGDEITFSPSDKDFAGKELIYIKRHDNTEKLTLPSYLKKTFPDVPSSEYVVSEIGKDKLKALKHVSDDSSKVVFYLARDKYVYEVGHESKDEKTQDEFRNTFYEMLSSFQYSVIEEKEAEIKEEVEEEKPKEDEKETVDEPPVAEEKDDEKIEEEPEKEPVKVSKEEPEDDDAAPTIGDISEEYALVIDYIKKNIGSIAPEDEELLENLYVTKFEFTGPNYVYTEYEDGHFARKALLGYTITNEEISTEVLAYYKPGEGRDWEKVEGEDIAAGESKEVLSVGSSGEIQQELSVLQGYRYFESAPFSFKIQFPADWYYSGGGGYYYFSDEPLSEDNRIVSLGISDASLDSVSGSLVELGGKRTVVTSENGDHVIYVERSSGGSYKLSAAPGYQNILETMAGSIID